MQAIYDLVRNKIGDIFEVEVVYIAFLYTIAEKLERGLTAYATSGQGEKKLEDGKLPKLRTSSKKRTQTQPSYTLHYKMYGQYLCVTGWVASRLEV